MVDVDFFHKRTFDRLLAEFGPYGPVVFLSLCAEAKKAATPGVVTANNEAQFWQLLGLQNQELPFTMDAFLKVTGQMKQTRRRRVGRRLDVTLTHYSTWQRDVPRRESERLRKARKRRESGADTHADTNADSHADAMRTDNDSDSYTPKPPHASREKHQFACGHCHQTFASEDQVVGHREDFHGVYADKPPESNGDRSYLDELAATVDLDQTAGTLDD